MKRILKFGPAAARQPIIPAQERRKWCGSIRQHAFTLSTTGWILEKNTQESYSATLSKFRDHHGNDRQLDGISSEEILSFLNKITEGGKQQTKHGRYSHLKAFFNFIRTNFDLALQNPCDAPMLRKLYRPGKPNRWDIVEKETISLYPS